MSFLAPLVLDNFRSLEKIELGPLFSAATPKEKFSARGLVHSYLNIRFDLPSFINFCDMNGFPKLGAQNPY